MPKIVSQPCRLKINDKTVEAKLESLKQKDGQNYYRLRAQTMPCIGNIFFISDTSEPYYEGNLEFDVHQSILRFIEDVNPADNKMQLIGYNSYVNSQDNGAVCNSFSKADCKIILNKVLSEQRLVAEKKCSVLAAITMFKEEFINQNLHDSVATIVLSSSDIDKGFSLNQQQVKEELNQIHSNALERNIKLNVVLVGIGYEYDTDLFKVVLNTLKINESDSVIITKIEQAKRAIDSINNYNLKVDNKLLLGRINQEKKSIDVCFTCENIGQVLAANSIKLAVDQQIQELDSEEESNEITRLALENDISTEYANLYLELMHGDITIERALEILVKFIRYGKSERIDLLQQNGALILKILSMINTIEQNQNAEKKQFEETTSNLFLIDSKDAIALEQYRPNSLKMIDDIFNSESTKEEIVKQLVNLEDINKTKLISYFQDIIDLQDCLQQDLKSPLEQINQLLSYKSQWDCLAKKLESEKYYICKKLADWIHKKSNKEYKTQLHQNIETITKSIEDIESNEELESWEPIVQALHNEKITNAFYAKQMQLNKAKYQNMQCYIDASKTVFVDFEKARVSINNLLFGLSYSIIPFASADSYESETLFTESKKIILNEIKHIEAIIALKQQSDSADNVKLANLQKELKKIEDDLSTAAYSEIKYALIKDSSIFAIKPQELSEKQKRLISAYECELRGNWERDIVLIQERNQCIAKIKTKFRQEMNSLKDVPSDEDIKSFLKQFINESAIPKVFRVFQARREFYTKTNQEFTLQDILENIIFLDDGGYIDALTDPEMKDIYKLLLPLQYTDFYSYKDAQLLRLKAIIIGTIAISKFCNAKLSLDKCIKTFAKLDMNIEAYSDYLCYRVKVSKDQITTFFEKFISNFSKSQRNEEEVFFWSNQNCFLYDNETSKMFEGDISNFNAFACRYLQKVDYPSVEEQELLKEIIGNINSKNPLVNDYIVSIQSLLNSKQFSIHNFISLLELLKKTNDYENLRILLAGIKNQQYFNSIYNEYESNASLLASQEQEKIQEVIGGEPNANEQAQFQSNDQQQQIVKGHPQEKQLKLRHSQNHDAESWSEKQEQTQQYLTNIPGKKHSFNWLKNIPGYSIFTESNPIWKKVLFGFGLVLFLPFIAAITLIRSCRSSEEDSVQLLKQLDDNNRNTIKKLDQEINFDESLTMKNKAQNTHNNHTQTINLNNSN